MGSVKNTKSISRRAIIKYTLLQIPGLSLLIIAMLFINYFWNIPDWLFWNLIIFWTAKDIIIFPKVWQAYDSKGANAAHNMIGMEGAVVEKLDPSGYIKIRSELWKAEISKNSETLTKGDTVRVTENHGMKLVVVAIK